MKKKVVVLSALLFLAGAFSVTISLNGFFFTTKYYESPLSAYNAEATYDLVYGETRVEKEIGLFEIDEGKALFIGELLDKRFLVAEMNVKNGKFAYEGTVIFYNYDDTFDKNNYNQTKTKSGYVKWTFCSTQQDVNKLTNVKSMKEYSLSNGSPLFLVIFAQ